MTKEQLIALLNDMSLEEKVNQMSQVIGVFFDDDTVITGPMAEMGFTEENIELSGSVIGSMGAETVKKIQKSYMEKHPHHIPLLFMLDIINGYKTVFPIPLGQGATFEPELSEKCAAVAAKEASVSGLHVTFAPMTDLVRDARWGRVMESTGEDPYLNGLFCESMVKGFQGENLSDEYKIAACVKHFAGYGAPTAGRDYNTVELSEHTFREFYLPSYKAGIDAGAALVMTSFNTVNGIPATGNKKLMRGILRDEMGFDGVLISDWAAIEETIYHGYCADKEDAAIRAVEAGVDIDMMTGIYCDNLCRLVREGKIPESLVDECCMRILELKNKLGLFENPYKDADEEKEQQLILCKEHRELAGGSKKVICSSEKRRTDPAVGQNEKDGIYRTLCKQQKSDGVLVDHRGSKGYYDSRRNHGSGRSRKQCGMLSGFPDAGSRGDTGRIYRGEPGNIYTGGRSEDAGRSSGSGEEGRSGGSVHWRRPSAVRRGNQQCHYSGPADSAEPSGAGSRDQ